MRDECISLDKIHTTNEVKSFLEQTIRNGAWLLLQQAIENEVNEYLESVKNRKDSEGRQQFVRNGYLPERQLQTGIGPIRVKQPRVRDKKADLQNIAVVYSPNIYEEVPSLPERNFDRKFSRSTWIHHGQRR